MYVCLCHGITDNAIKQAVREDGVGNMRQLREALGVGDQCGKCVRMAQSIVDSTIIDESLFKEVC
ncbi:bacterioferritin-associated ferredoxin [Paraglaciecola chathamensis]|uniref:Bacterioferritin-associated ferredoxin n=1 Tax=Paraglaciecola chathamensis TaxID=368405 RepID=A0A8H9IBC7_9ALTE|nr:bacterioferritin-associated ferredoxin [Paraglaciecola oceanifecundans]GGZ58218.1 bacterioferritin-associated ferredoxin [Paraglaciecola oceanifecundans]